MNILAELTETLMELDVPFETGHYSGTVPDEYVVIVPIADQLALFADNRPQGETQEAQLAIYSKGNFIRLRNRLTTALLKEDFTITDRRYIGFEEDTAFHHYIVNIEKNYELEG